MASGAYKPVTDGTRYVPPPSAPDSVWASKVQAQYGGNDVSFWQKLKTMFGDETGAIDLGYGPRKSLGTVAEMQSAKLSGAADAATAAQNMKLVQAKLGLTDQQMMALRQRLGGIPNGVPGSPAMGEQVAQQMAQSRLPVPPQVDPAMLRVPGSPQMGAAQQMGPRALNAAPVEASIPGMGEPFVAGPGGVSTPFQAYSPAAQSSPLALGAGDAAGVAGDATEAAMAKQAPGLLADLKGIPGTMKGALAQLRNTGMAAAEASPGMAGSALQGMATHPGLTALGGFAATMAAPYAKAGAQTVLGDAEGGAGDITGSALEGGLRWGGTAAMVPGVGPVAAPLAAIVGTGYGAVSAPLKQYYTAEKYDDYAGDFAKVIGSKGYYNKAPEAQHAFHKAALGIQNGKDVDFTLDGQQFHIPASQWGSGTDHLTQKTFALQSLVAAAKAYKDNGYSMGGPKAPGAGNTQSDADRAALSLQMGQAMASLGDQYTNSGVAGAQMIRDAIPNAPASIRGVMAADAASREAYSKQMGLAFQGSAAIAPYISAAEAANSERAQLLQQIRAAQTSGSSSSLASQLSSLPSGAASSLTPQQLAAMQQLAGNPSSFASGG